MSQHNLTPEQLDAVKAYARDHGTDWKESLTADWMCSGSRWSGPYHLLQQVRNQHGPRWLADFQDILGWSYALDKYGDSHSLVHLIIDKDGISACACGSKVRTAGMVERNPPTNACKRCKRYAEKHQPAQQTDSQTPASDSQPGYPIVIKSGSAFLSDLQQEECGSWEDSGHPEPDQPWMEKQADGPDTDVGEHPYNIIGRHKGKLELRTLDEAETIRDHVLLNSINKAEGFVEETRGYPGTRSPEYGKMYRWLRNLRNLRTRITAAIEETDPHRCNATDDDGRAVAPDHVTCGSCGNSWCERCDPTPSAHCHYCTGRGFSTASLGTTTKGE